VKRDVRIRVGERLYRISDLLCPAWVRHRGDVRIRVGSRSGRISNRRASKIVVDGLFLI